MNDVEPDFERAGSVRIARDSLLAGRGILVDGEPGSGRTHFVQALVSGVDEHVRRQLWVYDDDRRLDEQAQRRLADAMSKGEMIPVVVTPARHSSEPWLRSLSGENELLRIHLKPFDRAAMLHITTQFLTGTLDSEAVPLLIPHRAGGDLVILREAIREIQSSGTLSVSDGVWALSAPLPPLEGVRQLIFRRIGIEAPPADATVTALDVIGLAPELGLSRTRRLLEDILGDGAGLEVEVELERLETAGAIDIVEKDGAAGCRLHDPAVELLLPHTMGRLRRRRLSNAIIEALSERPASESTESELLALARLALPMGWAVDGATLTRAAETALRSSRIDLAGRLATAALASGAPVEASFVLAAVESQLGRSAEALARLERIQVDENAEPKRSRTRDELVQLVTARVNDPNSLWSLPVPQPDASLGSDTDTVRGLAALSISHPDDPETRGVAPWSATLVDHAAVLLGERIAFDASLMVMQGKTDRAIEMLHDAEVMLREAGADTFRVRWGLIYSRLWDQSFDTTLDEMSILGDEAASLGQAEQEMLCRWSAALTLGHAGRVAEAIPELQSALAGLDRLSLAEAALLARVALTKAYSIAGQPESAQEAFAPVLAASHGKPLLEGWALDARGWMLLGSGQPGAAEAFMTAAATHGALGLSLSQLIALSGAARAGAAGSVVGAIDGLADEVDGCCIALLVRQAHALARREASTSESADAAASDPSGSELGLAAEFDEIGDAAVALGMHGHAAESYSAAAELYRSGQHARAAAASARRAAEQSTVCGTTWFGSAEPDTSRLSTREREIAELVLAGFSNREIAEKFVLSVRTVETHLLQVFRKLGVRRRSELSQAMSDQSQAPDTRLKAPASRD